jgi:hypothetical protein
MPAPVHHLYLMIKPQDLRFQALGGHILLIVVNYLEVHEQPPQVLDGVSQVFRVEVQADEVVQRQEGAEQKLFLWKGDANSRTRPQDLLTLRCESLTPMVQVEPATHAALAGQALSALSDEGKLAVVIAGVASDALERLPGVTAPQVSGLKHWAEGVLAKGL